MKGEMSMFEDLRELLEGGNSDDIVEIPREVTTTTNSVENKEKSDIKVKLVSLRKFIENNKENLQSKLSVINAKINNIDPASFILMAVQKHDSSMRELVLYKSNRITVPDLPVSDVKLYSNYIIFNQSIDDKIKVRSYIGEKAGWISILYDDYTYYYKRIPRRRNTDSINIPPVNTTFMDSPVEMEIVRTLYPRIKETFGIYRSLSDYFSTIRNRTRNVFKMMLIDKIEYKLYNHFLSIRGGT